MDFLIKELRQAYLEGKRFVRSCNFKLESVAKKYGSSQRISPIYEVVTPLPITSVTRKVPPEILRPPYISKARKGEEQVPNKVLIKTAEEINGIATSCSLARSVLNALGKFVRPGRTTDELDEYAHNLIIQKGAYPSPLGFNGYPKSICTSVNNVVVHGIPDDRKLHNGDIVTIDVTVYYKGFHGDCAETYLIGNVDLRGIQLVKAAQKALRYGIECCGPGVPFNKIGYAVEKAARSSSLTVIPSVMGHGIGRFFHEKPDILHFQNDSYEEDDDKMLPGMVFTIEPAISEGTEEIDIYSDGWTAATTDDSRAAQFEHTILITNTSYEILTK